MTTNNKHIFLYAAVLLMSASPVAAQNSLLNKDSVRIDLGYGVSTSLANTTAAVSIITSEELQQTAAINLSDALYGRLLGLTALKTGGFSGDDGYGSSLNIRGYQTMNDNGMLILVDGMPRSIDRLTVAEVESVTVLRDAAAVALHGYRGVNGVLMVKTKRGGESEKLKIDASYQHKFTFSPKVADFVDGYTYASALNEARANDGLSAAYSDLELEIFKYGTDPTYYPNVNWKDQTLKNMGSEDMVNLSMHGGNKVARYFTMLDYTSSSGLLKDTDQGDYNSQLRYSKLNVRTNLDFKVTSTTDFSLSMLGYLAETKYPGSGNANSIMYNIYSTPASAFPVTLPDGTWGGNQNYGSSNPVANVQGTGYNKTHERCLRANASLKQSFDFWLKGLSATVSIGYDNLSRIDEARTKTFQYGYMSYTGNVGDRSSTSTTTYGDLINSLSYSSSQGNSWRGSQFSASVDYARLFGRHDVAASLIYESESETGMGRYNTYNRRNWMANLHYGYNERLMADVVLAFNGSNRSYPEKWAFSPTASVAWVFAKNNNAGVLNYGKVRASVGVQHSDYVSIDGIWMENYSGSHGSVVLGSNYTANWGTYLEYYPLTSFDLETAYKYNVGVDVRLFNALDLTFDAYFNRRTNIMMSDEDLNSWVLGRPSSYATEGKVDSYGIEFGANYVKQFANSLVLRAGANFTWGRNKIKSYIENVSEEYQSHVGQRVDQAYGLIAIGFFEDDDDIDNSPTQQFGEVKAGDIKYKDVNGDGVINDDDKVYMGYGTNLPETNYAFTLGAEYKRFGFNLTMQGATGQTKYLGTTGVWSVMSDNQNLSTHYYENRWIPGEDNSDALYPRLTTETNDNNAQSSSVWYENISWLKLRNVELYYRLPDTAARKCCLSAIKVFVKGENLFTISSMDVMDPELLGTNYPVMRGVTAGVNVSF